SGPPTVQVLATRGERLALARLLWRGATGDVRPSEVEYLLIVEVDERGKSHMLVSLNPNDLDAAHDELQARYEAGEAAMHPPITSSYLRAFAERDWDGIAALYPPNFVGRDHRRVAMLGTTHGA